MMLVRAGLTALVIGTGFVPGLAAAEGLALTVEGLRNGKGKVMVVVFDNAAAYNAFDYMNAVDYAEIPARKGQVTHHFKTMTKGPYAIVLFHDENNDDDLNYTDTHLLEGLGASGAPNPEDEPTFGQASVFPGKVTVHVHYDM
ncbi:DUF2141 domain-containing protein [uncultured Shimia sp.]|uniref:DUF2141 domain-containing protein n=1 Tax=uncultured Shimia sp. TaxID=573152 RepID=UPI0026169C99|nr:DUF2141 domain-containing protein [uncultured Shimia sp.]